MNIMKTIVLLMLSASLASSQTFPLVKSANGRYLQGQNGTPFQIRGVGSWCLPTGLDSAETRIYLLNKKAKGFNTILGQIVGHFYTANAPNNADNVAPFSTPGDFSTPNEAYFKYIDNLIRLADSLDMLVIAIPAYLGYPGTEQGWDTEIASSGNTKMRTWGRFLGGRYKNYANIIWMLGGDRNPSEAEMVSMEAVRNGIRDSITTQWFTLDTDSPTSAADAMLGRTWLDINQTYCYDPGQGEPQVYTAARADYARSPVQTFFYKEGYSEEIHLPGTWTTTNDQIIRRQNYWSILSGACGAFMQNEQDVYFESAYWLGSMDDNGSVQSGYCWSLFNSRNWWKLIPDRDATVMTAGSLSGASFATTAYASDSSSVIAYLPTRRAVTINPVKLKSADSLRVRWYNPSTKVVTDSGYYSYATRTYNQPGSGDWVMVIDAKSFVPLFGNPGDPIPSAPISQPYTTNFVGTENPISENGAWVNGRTTGIDWADCSKTPALAIGQGGIVDYTDGTALLTGSWGADQTAMAVVHSINQNDTCYQEVQLRLRSSLSAHNCTGYEIAYKCSRTPAAYLIIVRWNGPVGDFTILTSMYGGEYGVAGGDSVRATIVGNVITAYINGVQKATATDNMYSSGNPGMGFNLRGCTGVNGDYGYTSFTASDLPTSPLPIQLASFTATVVNQSQVRLNWTTLTEINNYGFEIQKSDTTQQHYQSIPNAFIAGHGSTNEPQHYNYIDSTVTPGVWYYRLKQIDLDGTVHYSDGVRVNMLTEVQEKEIPTVFSLSQNYPNPWNPSTTIRYGLPHISFVTLSVYNMLGQQVAQLVNEHQQVGYHDLVFRGEGLASGVYFYRIQAGVFVSIKKLLLLK